MREHIGSMLISDNFQASMPNWNERKKIYVLVFALKCEFAVISFAY